MRRRLLTSTFGVAAAAVVVALLLAVAAEAVPEALLSTSQVHVATANFAKLTFTMDWTSTSWLRDSSTAVAIAAVK